MPKKYPVRDSLAADIADKLPPELPTKDSVRDLHLPLTNDLISPEDATDEQVSLVPDELDEFGSTIENEGEWTQDRAPLITDEDITESHDWRIASEDSHEAGWVNEKIAEGLSKDRPPT